MEESLIVVVDPELLLEETQVIVVPDVVVERLLVIVELGSI